MMTDRILSQSSFSHVVDVPIAHRHCQLAFQLPEADTNAAARPITSRPVQRLTVDGWAS
jgi:hypothetical protein